MDTIKKVLHPSSHSNDDSSSSAIPSSAHTHPNAETQAALGDQPNVTGTDREAPAPSSEAVHHESHEHKQPRAGHHHPRQPVGATGLPPNHKPRSDFVGGGGGGAGAGGEPGVTGAEAGLASGGGGGDNDDVHNRLGKVAAESGNNFPGTNPHPEHSALGNKSVEGTQGTLNPGRE